MTKTRTEVAQAFISALFHPLPDDSALELRIKKPGGPIRSVFLTDLSTLRVHDYRMDENVWFGVALRRRGASTGAMTDLTWAPVVWADFDHLEGPAKRKVVEQLSRFPLRPSFIVDSGGGLHVYWRLTKFLNMRIESQATFLREVVHGLAVKLGADPTVHDPTRVLRLPGTYNPGNGTTKIYDPPRDVILLDEQRHTTFKVEDLSSYRVPVAVAQTIIAPPQGYAGPAAVRVSGRLHKLMKSGWSEGCGYPSRSELDFAIVVSMLRNDHTDDDVFAVFGNPEYGISEKFREKGADGPRYLAHSIAQARIFLAESKSEVTGGLKEKDGRLFAWRINHWKQIFPHEIKAVSRLYGDEEGFVVRINRPDGPTERILLAQNFVSNVDFKKALKMAGGWTGGDTDVQMLIDFFEEQHPPKQRAVRVIGWHDNTVIFPNAQLRDGIYSTDIGYAYVGHYRDKAWLKESDDWPALARQVFEVVPRLQDEGSMAAILGWFMATFLAPRIRAELKMGFPILMVYGSPEAGKTTILEHLSHLTGTKLDDTLKGSQPTLFAVIDAVASSNTMPMIYDEHKQAHIEKLKYSLYPVLRDAYTANYMSRGQRDLSVVHYKLVAPVAVAGETPFRDTALLDRTLHVRLNRDDKSEEALASVQALPLDEFNAGMYRHVAAVDLQALAAEARQFLPPHLQGAANIRQRNAWIVTILGLLLIRPHVPDERLRELIVRALASGQLVKTSLIVPATAVVVEAIRVLAELVKARRIRDGRDYILREDADGVLLLHFIPSLVLPLIEEYFHRVPTDLPMNRETVLDRMREESRRANPAVRAVGLQVWLSKRNARVVTLDLHRVEDLTGIPATFWRTEAISETFD